MCLSRIFSGVIRRQQELTSNSGKVQLIYVKVDDGKNIGSVIGELQTLLADYPIRSMDEYTALFTVNNIPALSKFTAVMVGISIFIGFAVVCLSMYMAVLQRTREIGVRIALGATAGDVVTMIVQEGAMVGAAGVMLGIGAAFGAARSLDALLYGVSSTDPVSFAAAGAFLLAVTLLASYIPARRAMHVDPLTALRHQ